jgi:hypothetical protein
MRMVIFSENPDILVRFGTTTDKVFSVLENISQHTETRDLVVSVYFISEGENWGGHANVRKWETSDSFFLPRWPPNRTGRFALPENLPQRFKLIRISFGGEIPPYPNQFKDKYRFKWRFETFDDHMAFVFAHELHHFRRYHLGLHSGEGEISTEKWAFEHVTALGYKVTLVGREKIVREVREAYKRLHLARPGMKLRFVHPSHREIKMGEIMRVLRPLSKNAHRIAVETANGRRLLVPIEWMELAECAKITKDSNLVGPGTLVE